MLTSSRGSFSGSGRRSHAFTSVNMAVVAAIPKASVMSSVAQVAGERRSCRTPTSRSFAITESLLRQSSARMSGVLRRSSFYIDQNLAQRFVRSPGLNPVRYIQCCHAPLDNFLSTRYKSAFPLRSSYATCCSSSSDCADSDSGNYWSFFFAISFIAVSPGTKALNYRERYFPVQLDWRSANFARWVPRGFCESHRG